MTAGPFILYKSAYDRLINGHSWSDDDHYGVLVGASYTPSVDEEKGIHVKTLTSRLDDSGWGIEKALETPVKSRSTPVLSQPS